MTCRHGKQADIVCQQCDAEVLSGQVEYPGACPVHPTMPGGWPAPCAICVVIAERDAALDDAAEQDEYLHRCNEMLGEAGILIGEGPGDGIATLIDQRDAAVQRAESLEAMQATHAIEGLRREARAQAAEARVATLEAALHEYGWHKRACDDRMAGAEANGRPAVCRCGLDAALKGGQP